MCCSSCTCHASIHHAHVPPCAHFCPIDWRFCASQRCTWRHTLWLPLEQCLERGISILRHFDLTSCLRLHLLHEKHILLLLLLLEQQACM